MSIWDRALRLARSNLNDIADRASSIGRGRSLEDMTDEELEEELERRRREAATRAAVEEARRKADARGGDDGGGDDLHSPRSPHGSAAIDLMDLSPRRRRDIRQYYANLELPFGASLEEVKQSYRRLMRQYHPDKHQNDPARRQLATQLSQKLTKAYNELNQELKKQKK